MAQSPAHKLGQIIGNVIEEAIRTDLNEVAKRHGLYLDWNHPRSARDGKRKVSWKDNLGNSHDLDYVLEAGGSDNEIGVPKAFIEIAHRRYTKHSRNKAQEIQGAITPLATKYRDSRPFLGVVLAGIFTEGALQQLESNGFGILYFDFDVIVEAFSSQGIDAHFDEDTSDAQVQQKINAYQRLSPRRKSQITCRLRELREQDIAHFISLLENSLKRTVTRVIIAPSWQNERNYIPQRSDRIYL
ncbi:MAG: DNA methylase, partial [Pseudomonadales bacterium]|nr:DNA methylase [Pseudomonadales bacterium]